MDFKGKTHVELPWGFGAVIHREGRGMCCSSRVVLLCVNQCFIIFYILSMSLYQSPKRRNCKFLRKGVYTVLPFPLFRGCKRLHVHFGLFLVHKSDSGQSTNYFRRLASSSVFYCQAMIVYRIVCGQCPGWFVWSPEHFVVLYVHVITRMFLILIHVSIYARAENTTRECIWKPLKLQSQVLEDVGLTSGKWTFAMYHNLSQNTRKQKSAQRRFVFIISFKIRFHIR